MKKIFFILATLFATSISAQNQADITFENDTLQLGTFSEDSPVRTGKFCFTNTGTAPLIINQAIASCGCTVPEFSKSPIKPGDIGFIEVTYNGRGKLTGPFTKTISIRSNAKSGIKRIYVKGYMKEGNK